MSHERFYYMPGLESRTDMIVNENSVNGNHDLIDAAVVLTLVGAVPTCFVLTAGVNWIIQHPDQFQKIYHAVISSIAH